MFAGCGPAQVARGGGDTPQTERPWNDYSTKHPSQRRNSRKSKTDPNALSLKLKLWMDRSNHTSCPQDMLRRRETTEKLRPMTATHTAHEEPHNRRTDGVWKMLSLDEALSSLEEGLQPQPSVHDIAFLLHKCRKERNQASALRLHAYMLKSGLEAHPSLGNRLVLMLVAVGSMCHAQQVFDRLLHRNLCSWNSLILGYVKHGEWQHALILYQKMQEDDSVHPSPYVFAALLKACAELKDLKRGCKIHADIARKRLLERHIGVGSALVSMYAKCSSLAKAQEVFDKLPVRNVVSWNSLIAGYAKHGQGEEALKCFEQMQHEGVPPNAVTFVCSLMACGSIGAADKGREIHVEIARKGLLQRDLRVGNALIGMYAKCGLLTKAHEVLDKLSAQDVVSWNALIAGYAQHGHGEEALKCFEQMQHLGISPDAVTFVCSLKACGSIGAFEKGREIHAEISRKGLLERDLVLGSTLVDMYAKCGSLAKAREVFDKLPARNIVTWNALITGYAQHGHGEEAVTCFELLKCEGVSPDSITFICSLKACGSIGATDKGEEIHAEIARKGLLERDIAVGNTLVDMYAKCGSLAKAQEVFDKLPVRDVVSWNTLMSGYVENGCFKEALNTFEQMKHDGFSPDTVTFVCSLKACGSIQAIDTGQEIHAEIARKGLLEKDRVVGNALIDMYVKCGFLAKAQEVFVRLPVRDVVSWTALITGYAEHECGEDALDCFEQMQQEGVSPNALTFVCILKACGTIGAIDTGRDIHAEITRKGLLDTDIVGSALIDMYAKCGWLEEAQQVFDLLLVRDVVSWTGLMAGYAQLGESENVFHVFDKMVGEGIKPNLVTFISVLNACSHTGLIDKGQAYFEAMSKDYDVIPTIEHHTCMFDLLGRAGQLEKAVAMIKKISLHPDLVVWHTVLSACRKWGNVELGRQAFEHVVRLDEMDPAAYVCMYNIYADVDMQDEETKFEAMRVDKQSWKKPGHCL